jgi:hypothetical protein
MPTVFAACSDALTLAFANRERPVILFKLLDPGLETSAGCIHRRNPDSNHVNAKPNPIQNQNRKEKKRETETHKLAVESKDILAERLKSKLVSERTRTANTTTPC